MIFITHVSTEEFVKGSLFGAITITYNTAARTTVIATIWMCR